MMGAKGPNHRDRESHMNIRTRLSILLLLCIVAGSTGLQAKELYRWTDENGVVHYSDQKPPSGQAFQTERIADTPAAPPPAAAEAAEEAQPSVAQQRREEIAQKKREAREEQAERDERCAAWQAEVDRLEPNRRVFYTNEQGETERMDDVERVERVADLKRQIAANCN
jgi:hypothetical protein